MCTWSERILTLLLAPSLAPQSCLFLSPPLSLLFFTSLICYSSPTSILTTFAFLFPLPFFIFHTLFHIFFNFPFMSSIIPVFSLHWPFLYPLYPIQGHRRVCAAIGSETGYILDGSLVLFSLVLCNL